MSSVKVSSHVWLLNHFSVVSEGFITCWECESKFLRPHNFPRRLFVHYIFSGGGGGGARLWTKILSASSAHSTIPSYYSGNISKGYFSTVGKQSPWYLSFVYTSHVSVDVRTALNFGKQTVPFLFCNSKFDTYTIICGVKLLSFSTITFCKPFLIL